MRITHDEIEQAVRLTRDRYVKVGETKTIKEIDNAFQESSCGFCALSYDDSCFNGSCPINNIDDEDKDTSTCCTEYMWVSGSNDITKVHEAAHYLIKRMEAFDIPKIVREINKAIKKEEADNASDKA